MKEKQKRRRNKAIPAKYKGRSADDYYDEFAPVLTAMGRLNPVSRIILVSFCENCVALDKAYHGMNALCPSLLEETVNIKGNGEEQINYKEAEYSKMARHYSKLVMAQARQLGISDVPADREQDEMERMMDK